MDAVYDTCNARDSHNKSINCPISANQMWAHIWTLAAYGAAEHCQTWPTGLLKELAIYFTTACCKLRGALAPVPPSEIDYSSPLDLVGAEGNFVDHELDMFVTSIHTPHRDWIYQPHERLSPASTFSPSAIFFF